MRTHQGAKGRPASIADVVTPPPSDPWGNAYVLDATASQLVLRSLGPDGKPDTADDLRVAVN